MLLEIEEKAKLMDKKYDADLNELESAEYLHFALKNSTPVKIRHGRKLFPDIDPYSLLAPVEMQKKAGFEHLDPRKFSK